MRPNVVVQTFIATGSVVDIEIRSEVKQPRVAGLAAASIAGPFCSVLELQ